MNAGTAIIAWASLGVAAAAAGMPAPTERAPALDRLFGCRSVAKAEDRLACFDRETAALDHAIERHDVAVLDVDQVQRNRRAMFGLSDPDGRMVARNIKPVSVPFKAIDSSIQSVSPSGYGHYTLVTKDGSVWRNVDLFDSSPSAGAPVHIEKTPLGAYLLKMPHFQSVHAVRIR